MAKEICMIQRSEFLPTPSVRRATCRMMISKCRSSRFLPTPSARRATLYIQIWAGCDDISTHALREEGDVKLLSLCCHQVKISTHALREEGDRMAALPARARSPISTHALREEGDLAVELRTPAYRISTHALREEGDSDRQQCRRSCW